MKRLLEDAVITPDQMTAIPEALRDQAIALTQAIDAAPGISVAIVFHVEGQQAGDGVPLMIAGDLAVMSGHLLGTAVGLATAQGLLDGSACQCPACVARRTGRAVRA